MSTARLLELARSAPERIALASDQLAALYTQRVLGIRKEYPDLGCPGVTALVLTSRLFTTLSGAQIEGKFPTHGAAIVAGNHTRSTDILLVTETCVRSGRMMKALGRDTLLNPNLQEDPEILKRTGKEINDLDNIHPLLAHLRANILKDTGAIPVRRGSADRHAIAAALEALDRQLLVGAFVQETRVREGDLRDLFSGTAFLAMKRPDVPIYPISISGPPNGDHKLVVGEPFTYNQARNDPDYSDAGNLKSMTVYIADQIAKNLPPSIQTKWREVDRPAALARV